MAKTAFLFPGQGAQAVGMCHDVVGKAPKAKELFDRAEAILGYDLLGHCINGPKEKLDSTVISQPALYVAGLAAIEQLKGDDPSLLDGVEAAAGLSLGEYTALAFAGAVSFEDGLRVVKARGEAMQAAADATPSTMVSVLGLDDAKLNELCDAASTANHFVRPANFLCPGNTAVSGHLEACDQLERMAPDFGAMKTIRLAVAGAFHTSIMRPADERLAAALAKAELDSPKLPVVSNVDGLPHQDPTEIRAILVRQVLEPVRWEASMRWLLEQGFDRFVELGPGRVLAGLMKRIHRKADMVNVTV